MRGYIYYRLFGYTTTIIMHLTNMYLMVSGLKNEHYKDPDLILFGNLQTRYFTCWTFFLQIIYAIIGIICDVLTMRNYKAKDYSLLRHLLRIRDTLFAAVIWPSTFLVFTVFWSLFLYDRDLIFPKFIDKVLTPASNHVIHTAIVPVVLWELMFRPRNEPKSHVRYICHTVFHIALYFIVLAYTYTERGIWIYPILTKTFGTVYFPIICATMCFAKLFYYKLQWTLNSMIHGKNVTGKKKL